MRSLAIVLAVLLVACEQQSTSPSAEAAAFDLPADNVAYGWTVRMLNNGVMTALMLTDTAYVYDDGRPQDFKGVDVTFYDERGAEAGRLTSETGQYDMTSGLFVARGNVVLVTPGADSGRRLETSELHYNVRGDELWSDSTFTMTEEGRVSTGTSFHTDSRFQTWQVTGGRTQGAVPGEGGIRF
jgi:LPS export ABC transporter protein LptC